jgi:ADP-dependent NAD(P)H-hydrate dehydratase
MLLRRLKPKTRRLRLSPIIWLPRVADAFTPLDSDWLRAHPLPDPANNADKNGRGRVLVIGGSRFVPGGIALTAEAALRAGAGKVQVATISSVALPLGMAMPEIAVIALDETADGELIADRETLAPLLANCDAVVAGPAMSDAGAASILLDTLFSAAKCSNLPTMIFDAAALLALPRFAERLRRSVCPVILTPNIGEMAAMLKCSAAEIHPADAAMCAARHFGATVMLKGPTSFIATQNGDLFAYAGGGVGLATGGSGDVLAGIAGGLAGRGASSIEAILWAVWLHGEAGRRCAEKTGPLGYLARELLVEVPSLLRSV